jgi:REP element-mobilizing transposase RayT
LQHFRIGAASGNISESADWNPPLRESRMTELDIYDHHRLPHWRLEGSTYFVTWRLIPGQPDLGEPERDLIANALRFFDNARYSLDAFVIMNDHVHLVLTPKENWKLEQLVYSIKRFTSTQMVKDFGRKAPIWQKEYYDHILRNQADWEEKVGYILTNPQRRWGEIKDYKWVYLRDA